MTGMVGTALYVSPEVQGNTKATYNQVKKKKQQSQFNFVVAFYLFLIFILPTES